MQALALSVFLALAFSAYDVVGHGMMFDPPQRSSMWRFGFNTPVNTADDFLSCGYVQVQYDDVNQGRCGECGDIWSDPRPRNNDEGGLYGTGTIGRVYEQGSLIDVTINLNISHMGFFEFRLCPKTSSEELVTQECLNQNLLTLADGTTQFNVEQNTVAVVFAIQVQLPAEITCENCVLQWYYRASSRIGDCGDGTTDYGCGDQETYVNCADIAIL
ncbi:uncharacterized protein LOC116929479 [Daphnia magna]|uniref:Chitin-binding type-4 domain-containing protein n=2 Tax=Daphnia magna TaxID=35525 RepID=A0A164TMG9_9CRUS|nr:uncharacterized protein LOC116929479 [Daphnia magna]KZS10585.1 Uncharacterized protein APZ42_024866 [Daphnia magna]